MLTCRRWTQEFGVVWSQVDKIVQLCNSQEWDGVDVVTDLPGLPRSQSDVRIHQQRGRLQLQRHAPELKEGRDKYRSSDENAVGYMFQFKIEGILCLLPVYVQYYNIAIISCFTCYKNQKCGSSHILEVLTVPP